MRTHTNCVQASSVSGQGCVSHSVFLRIAIAFIRNVNLPITYILAALTMYDVCACDSFLRVCRNLC